MRSELQRAALAAAEADGGREVTAGCVGHPAVAVVRFAREPTDGTLLALRFGGFEPTAPRVWAWVERQPVL